MKRTILLLLFLTGIVRSSYAQWQPYLHIADSIAVANVLNAGPFNLLTGPIDFQARINQDSAIRKLATIPFQTVCANGSTTTYQVRFGSIPNQVNIDSNGINSNWGTNNLWSFYNISNEPVWYFKGYGNSFGTLITSAQLSGTQHLVIPNKSGTTDTFAMKSDIGVLFSQTTTAASYTGTLTPTSTVSSPMSNVTYDATAQAGDLFIANPTGSWANHQILIITVKDNGTIRNLTYGANFIDCVSPSIPKASATVVGETLEEEYEYNTQAAQFFLQGQTFH